MPHTVSALLESSPGGSSYNVGLIIGDNNILFHPGLAGGALRVEGPGGFGNTNVGFTPARDILHLLEVRQFPNGLYEITLTDRNAPFNNVFTASFLNPGSVGGSIALRRSGGATGPGLYDNLVIQHIPEPGTLALFALGAGALLRRRQRS